MADEAVRRGAWAGLVAGLATAAAMYLAAALVGLRTLPEALQQPVLATMPGPVFGFLIDNLQHAGKVLEEAGLLVVMVLALSALGIAAGVVAQRRRLPRTGLLAGATGWLIVTLLLLPVAGDGFLGLRGGLTEPLGWAVVFAIYALVWEAVWSPPRASEASEPDLGRRRLVTALPAGLALGSLALVGVLKVPGWVRDVTSPPEAGLSGPVPEITPVANFYVVSKNFSDPVVSASDWSLRVAGLVDRTLRLDYAQLRGLPSTTQTATLECVSNDVGGNLLSTGSFTGVPLRDLLIMASPLSKATAVTFKARDGFTESATLKMVMDDPTILVAYNLGGSPLPDKHGFPARILIPGHYGMRGPKWLEEISLTDSDSGGYWEGQGWDHQAVVKTTARFDSPRADAFLPSAPLELAGVAFAGVRGVQAVEWSADGGRTWSAAELKPPLSPLTWTLWRSTWTPPREGAYALQVRARDGHGDLQTSQVAPSFPNGATGYHTIHVTISKQ
jgi:DMSO/TMAO reductase YedYZ molybdopterin-dependent catalytic subunit